MTIRKRILLKFLFHIRTISVVSLNKIQVDFIYGQKVVAIRWEKADNARQAFIDEYKKCVIMVDLTIQQSVTRILLIVSGVPEESII